MKAVDGVAGGAIPPRATSPQVTGPGRFERKDLITDAAAIRDDRTLGRRDHDRFVPDHVVDDVDLAEDRERKGR